MGWRKPSWRKRRRQRKRFAMMLVLLALDEAYTDQLLELTNTFSGGLETLVTLEQEGAIESRWEGEVYGERLSAVESIERGHRWKAEHHRPRRRYYRLADKLTALEEIRALFT